MDEKKKPEFDWLKSIYSQMHNKYNEHLVKFYVVHPTFWLKIVHSFFSTFVGDTDFWTKVRYIETLSDLFQYFDSSKLLIPEEVFLYDRTVSHSVVDTGAEDHFDDI